MECDRAVALLLPLENVARLAQKMGDVDGGERIGAFDDKEIAVIQSAQGLARAQGRQRTVKAAKVESRAVRLGRHRRQVSCAPGWKTASRGKVGDTAAKFQRERAGLNEETEGVIAAGIDWELAFSCA
jgi:hypothetical protein